MANEIASRLKSSILDPSIQLWFPDLTADLVEAGWDKVGRELNLNQETYSTAKVLTRDPQGPREVVSNLTIPSVDGSIRNAISVELLPEELASEYADSSVRFFNEKEILEGDLVRRVEGALRILAVVPSLSATVCSLVRSVHLIDAGNDDIDVSFSEPNLPFSVFVSVPSLEAEAGELRVAEALLHEAMHLQLTHVESHVPLVESGERSYFSPWKNEYRTPQGVLHALYVFKVIDKFLGLFAGEGSLCVTTRGHVQERRKTIAGQVQEIHCFRECEDLTPEGVEFVKRLLN